MCECVCVCVESLRVRQGSAVASRLVDDPKKEPQWGRDSARVWA